MAAEPPESVAVSLIGLPNVLGPVACVVRLGAAATTDVLASALSFSEFGSFEELMKAVLRYNVPEDSPCGICPTRANVLVVPFATLEFVQVIVPPLPATGWVHNHPAWAWSDTKVMSPGRVSINLALEAESGPSLLTWMVKVTFELARTWSESTVLVTTRSAVGSGTVVVAGELSFSLFGSDVWLLLTRAMLVNVVPGAV